MLAVKLHPTKPSKLTDDEKQQLVEIFLAGPIAAGFKPDLWTCTRVAQVVRKKFRVECHPGHLSRTLHDLGFSSHKPAQVAREQDSEAVKQWIKKDRPRIKKNHAESGLALSLSTKLALACNR